MRTTIEMLESFFSKVETKLVDYGLDNIVRSINGNDFKVETLRTNSNALIAKACDVEEQLRVGELLGNKKRKREVDNWLREVKGVEIELQILQNEEVEEKFLTQFFCGHPVVKLNAMVEGLMVQSQHFGELLLDAYKARGEPLLTTGMFGAAFDENLRRICKNLMGDGGVVSIGVYGMGGVGKTMLAKHIHNRLVNETRDNVYWVTVSQESSIKKLQNDIAKVIGEDLSNEDDEEKIAARLNRAFFQRKNFVLILDDVWEDVNLEEVGNPLCVQGCRMIITTRSLEVCRRLGCQEIVEVKTLEENEAWDLFKFTLGHYTQLSPQAQEIARLVARKCDGLPLGIIVLAKIMKGVTDIREWRNALTELDECRMTQLDDMEKRVFGTIQYSFKRVREKLQRCFLFCSLYPEGYLIDRDELVTKFIAEELVEKRKNRSSQFDLGHAILNKLVNLCLLESEGGDKYVKMHDLVRTMALKIMSTDNQKFSVLAGVSLKEIPNEDEWTEDLEKMSLMCNKILKIPHGTHPNCPKLSTLFLNENFGLEFIPDSFFIWLKRLCVLDLSHTSIMELPNSLSDLERLNALFLGCCEKLVFVPCLGKLKELRELDISYTGITEVPQGMEELVNLKNLSMNGAGDLEMLPSGLILRFPSLQRLVLPYQIQASVEEIVGLKQLEEFVGGFKDVCDFNKFTKSQKDLGRYPSFYYIQVINLSEKCELEIYGKKIDYKRLHFLGCKFKKEDDTLLPENLQQLVFEKCEGLSSCLSDHISQDNVPTSLENLEISYCEGVECILTTNMSRHPNSSHSLLHSLKEIWLEKLPNFMGVMMNNQEFVSPAAEAPPTLSLPSSHVLSSLTELHVYECNEMKSLGLPLTSLPIIQRISVVDCKSIQEIIEETDNAESEDHAISLPNLKELCLKRLPKLKRTCKGNTMSCDSIQIITLMSCPKLKRLPLFLPSFPGQHQSPPPNLKEINIAIADNKWWESLEWESPATKLVFQSFLKHV